MNPQLVTPASLQSDVIIVIRRSESRLTVHADTRLGNGEQLTSEKMQDFRTAINEIAGDRLSVMPQGSTEYDLTGDDITTMTEADVREIFAGLPDMFVVTEVEIY